MLSKHNSESAPKLFCEKCGFSTVLKTKLQIHMRLKHYTEHHKKCPYCEKRFPQSQKLHIHIDQYHAEKEEKNYSCEPCKRYFTYETSYKNHVNFKCRFSEYYQKFKNYKEKKITFNCDYCSESFFVRKSPQIKNHYITCHPNKPIIANEHPKYKCTQCNEFYFFEEELNCHYNLDHGVKTEKNYCPKCKQSYTENHKCIVDYQREYYKKRHEEGSLKKAKRHPCHLCDMTYSTSAHLKGHIKTVHEKILDYECQHCGKKVGSQVKLQNHINACHSQVRCEICGKDIANPYDLKKHKVFVHKETEGVWLCPRCPKSMFLTKSMFERHVKTKH